MAHIDSNQHGAHLIHGFWELHQVKITLSLRVDLLEKIRGNTHESFPSCGVSRDHLRWDLELSKELLVHRVIVLVAQDDKSDLRMTEVIFSVEHIVDELMLDLVITCLVFRLNEVGVFNFHLEANASFLEITKHTISFVEQRPLPSTTVLILLVLINHDPFLLEQMLRLVNGSFLHRSFRALDDLVA